MRGDACRPAGIVLSGLALYLSHGPGAREIGDITLHAVVRTGGKQYRVEEGRPIKVDRLPGEVGAKVELGEVLLLADGDDVTVGAPAIAGARVLGTIAEQGRARKIVVFRYKAKTRSRKKTGHRQHFTRIVVDDILAPGQEPRPKETKERAEPEAESKPKGRRGRKAEAAAQVAAAEESLEPAASPSAEAPAVADAGPAASGDAAADTAAAAESAEAPPDEEKPKRSRRKAE
jgi:large subunit ribosomal protein L21